jgi:hypothetical protein
MSSDPSDDETPSGEAWSFLNSLARADRAFEQSRTTGDGGEEEGDGALLLLVGEDVGARDTGMVVDGNADPTSKASALRSSAS